MIQKRILYTLLGIAFSTVTNFTFAQVELGPHIGVDDLPDNTDVICGYPIPDSPDMTFNSYPFFAGETIPDFTLYDLDDNAMNMATLLDEGKPIVIVALNFTCPYIRNQVDTYNDILASYADEVTIVGIYQLEAHPDDDYSPNSGSYGNVAVNEDAGIVINQHQTYLDRKTAAQDFIDYTDIEIPIYMDGPCNEWWESFGPGPATGYIIRPNGKVFVKHGWFDKEANGHDIYCDLDSLLYDTSCDVEPLDGDFTLEMTTGETVYGLPGETIDAECDLINSSDEDVLIEIIREENDLDLGWTSAICADICLDPGSDYYEFILPAGTTQHFYMHFYSDGGVPGSGHTKMTFRNVEDFSNQYVKDFYAHSSLSGINEETNSIINVYPNPNTGHFSIRTADNETISTIIIYDISGKIVFEMHELSTTEMTIDQPYLTAGLYYLEVYSSDELLGRERVVVE